MCTRIIPKIQFTILRSRGLTSRIKIRVVYSSRQSRGKWCSPERRTSILHLLSLPPLPPSLPTRRDFFETLCLSRSKLLGKSTLTNPLLYYTIEAILKRTTNLPLPLRKISTEELTLEYRRSSRSRKVSI